MATPSNIVDLPSSDDEDEPTTKKPQNPSHHSSSSSNAQHTDQPIRSFWKAGDYAVSLTKSVQQQGLLEHARVHPKFLHSNATSHKWAFGAIAELLDNAVDEISKGATFVKLDKISNVRDHSPALLFHDNGGGMGPDSIRQCMSLGYSKKKENTIGQYGNGFKTSTMRLGADVIVFTRTTNGSHATQSIGLLSYTFLRRTGQDDVIVPMIDFNLSEDHTQPIIYGSLDDWSSNLRIILEWSPFVSEQDLMLQFADIGPHGTKVIVFNLWQNDDGLLELDFDYDEEDIRLRDEINREKSMKHDRLIESHISHQIRFSLRAYASILYLRKFENFEIILRGKSVQQCNIVDDLKYTEVVWYRPQLGGASKEVSVKTEIGFVKEAPFLGVSGVNVYHKNRLIIPFWKLTPDGNSRGNGVIGVLEANFIEPAHDKQDFERSALFLRLETRLKQIIIDYWKTHCCLIGIKTYEPVRRNAQRELHTQSFEDNASNLQRGFSTNQPVIGLSANMQQEMRLVQPVIGVAANAQSLSNEKSIHGPISNGHLDMSNVQPVIGLAADTQTQGNTKYTGNQKEGSVQPASSSLIDQICEENIQLFMRCEKYREKHTVLEQTIKELERQIAETKNKCSQLSSYLETRKKQKGP